MIFGLIGSAVVLVPLRKKCNPEKVYPTVTIRKNPTMSILKNSLNKDEKVTEDLLGKLTEAYAMEHLGGMDPRSFFIVDQAGNRLKHGKNLRKVSHITVKVLNFFC